MGRGEAGQRTIHEVLGIGGSPRHQGNTDLLLDQALAGAESQGAKTGKIVLHDLNIHPCRHCGGCQHTGRCVIQDDMQEIYPKLRAMDVLILATPIFFMGPTAQTKMMIDRCQCLWVTKYVLKQPVYDKGPQQRKGMLIAVGGTTFSTLFRPLQIIGRAVFATLDVEYGNNLFFSDIDEKGAIRMHPTALEDAFKAGAALARGDGSSYLHLLDCREEVTAGAGKREWLGRDWG